MDFPHIILLLLATLMSTTIAKQNHGLPLPINLLPTSGSNSHPINSPECESWHLAVETNNKRNWIAVPFGCFEYVKTYMLTPQYRSDSSAVVAEAMKYAESVKLSGNGTDVWVFDIDETAISNLLYFAAHGFGTVPLDATTFFAWMIRSEARQLPETFKLYEKVLSLGIKVLFMTGRNEKVMRDSTTLNLQREGYRSWTKLLLKPTKYHGSTGSFKSGERKKLVNEGYRIVGNIGDQWSDILGTPEGERTFKLPNPMYYTA